MYRIFKSRYATLCRYGNSEPNPLTESKFHSLAVKCTVKGEKEKVKMRRRAKKEEDEEVEAVLEAAEAMMLLQLTTDSHLTRGGSDSLSADLSRRFNALKAPPSTNPTPSPALTGPDAGEKAIPDEEMKRVLGDGLSARFAALKAASSSSAGDSSGLDLRKRGEDDSSDDGDVDEEGVSKKEVEKLMQWARDAARLDPSPPSDDDEDGKQLDVKEYGSSDSDGELRKKKSSGKDSEKKKKKKKKLWF